MKDIKTPFEEKRNKFLADYKKQRTINLIVLIAGLAVVLVCFIVFRNNMTPALIAGFVVVICLLVYTQIMKRKMNKKVTDYINDFYSITSDGVLDESGFSDFTFNEEGEISKDEVEKSEIMKNITFVKSRNFHFGKVGDKDVRMSDLLFKVSSEPKKNVVAYCGKFIQVDLDKVFEGKALIYLKPATPASGPDILDDMKLLEDDSKIAIYSNDSKFAVNNKKFIDTFKKLSINTYLLDATVTIVKDTLTIALSLDDSVMVVPLYEELKVEGFEEVAKVLKVVHDLIEEKIEMKKPRRVTKKEEIEETSVEEVKETPLEDDPQEVVEDVEVEETEEE